MIRQLVVLGSGGNTLDVLDTVAAINARQPSWAILGLLDDAVRPGLASIGLPTFGRIEQAAALAAADGPLAHAFFVNAIGSERNHAARAGIVARAGLDIGRFATLVHPGASVSAQATLGHGCCINFGACIGGRVAVRDHVWVGPGCVIGHDCMLDAHSIVAPRATLSGAVHLGSGSYVGSAAAVRQGVSIGAGALIGMGAVVLRDVIAGSVVVGNPARPLARRGTAALPDPAASLP